MIDYPSVITGKGVLDLLNINDKTPLDISTDGKILLISPVRDEKRRKLFQAALEKAIENDKALYT